MNRAVLVLSLSCLFISSWGCHKCSSCQDPNQNATQGGGEGGGGGSGPDPLAGGDWYVVNPQDAPHSVKVDLKSIRSVDSQDADALEYTGHWPTTPQLEAALVSENISMPPGSKWIVRSRVVCTPKGPIAYDVENRIVDPNGKELRKRSYKPGEERHTAEMPPNGPTDMSAYRQDAPSLVCLVAKMRCDHKNFSWPPPQNPAGLGTDDGAKKLRAEYNEGFVPACKLTPSGAAP